MKEARHIKKRGNRFHTWYQACTWYLGCRCAAAVVVVVIFFVFTLLRTWEYIVGARI